MRAFLVLTFGLILAACGTGTAPLTNDDFASELNVDLNAMTQTASGLYHQDIQVGSGTQAERRTAGHPSQLDVGVRHRVAERDAVS